VLLGAQSFAHPEVFFQHMHQLVPGRECGECTLCCIVPAIDKPEMQKLPSSVCGHCDKGCAIYENRPETCRTYYCGWRWLPIFGDDWRPDQSGVFAQMESEVPAHFNSPFGLVLLLVGNPLKTIRQPHFIDFVTRSISNNMPLSLGLPGPKGKQSAKMSLNTREMFDASRRSRSDTRLVLENTLKRLSAHDFIAYPMEFAGNDVST
jgi:hypothetical protein